MEPEQIADVLDDAADYIEANGWWPGEGMGPRPACASNAIRCVTVDVGEERTPVMLCANEVFASTIGFDGGYDYLTHIFEWNDAEGRTKQQVLDAFRAAAKQQRGLAQAAAQVQPETVAGA